MLRKKRRTSIRAIGQVAKDALAADNSQRTARMGMIGMDRDGKKHKKQRKKHGLLVSRTRAGRYKQKSVQVRTGQKRKMIFHHYNKQNSHATEHVLRRSR